MTDAEINRLKEEGYKNLDEHLLKKADRTKFVPDADGKGGTFLYIFDPKGRLLND